MTTIDEILKEFPPGVRQLVEPIYAGLPPDRQQQIGEMLKSLRGSDVKGIRGLLELVLEQYRPLAGQKKRIAIVGPVNTGKSSLYNQFIRRAQDKAVVGPVPGTTRANQEADAGLFAVVDTPGADAYGPVGQSERRAAFDAAAAADLLIAVFDASKGIAGPDRQLYDDLSALGKAHVVVLNKIDLIAPRDRLAVTAKVAANLGLAAEQIIPTSATSGENVGQVLLAAAKAAPDVVVAMGRALPAYRYQLAWPRVLKAAAAAGVIALTPLPVISFIPLLTLQAGLVLTVAGIYGYPITVDRARELVATFGAAFGARMLFQQLSETVPVAGWVLSATIATATTAAMGYAAIQWFDRGDKLSGEDMRTMARDWASALASRLRASGSSRPGKESLRDRLESLLSEIARPRGR
jgi:small GTP-binding protein